MGRIYNMSRQKADNKEVSNDIIYEKFLDVSDAVDNMSKLKDILKTEIALQQQILETSVQLGFSFDINNDEENEFHAEAVLSKDEIVQTYFENQCLEAENKVVTKLLNDIKRDYEELESEEVNEIFTEELEDLRRESLTSSHQLKDDVIEEAKNKYSIHRKKSALQEKCSCVEQLLSMVLGDSDATSENQTIDVTIKETSRLYENLHEKFDDLKISLTESQKLRREHTKQISPIPLTTRQILSALKNTKIFDLEH